MGVAEGVGVAVGVGVGVAVGVALGVGAPVAPTVSTEVGETVGATVEPHAARPTAAIAVPMTVVSFIAATRSTGASHQRLQTRQMRRTLSATKRPHDPLSISAF